MKATMTVIMMFTKNAKMRGEKNLISAKKKKFDYKKLDDYNYTFDEEKGAKLKLDQEKKMFIAEIKGCW